VWRTKGEPANAIAIGTTTDGARFIANAADEATLALAAQTDLIGAHVTLHFDGKRNRFALTANG
jgi:acetyl-CoA C-acetyltransferase